VHSYEKIIAVVVRNGYDTEVSPIDTVYGYHTQVNIKPKKRYKPVGIKKNPVVTNQPESAEDDVMEELEDWHRRMMIRDDKHSIKPFINEDNINELNLPKNWSEQELDYLKHALLRLSKAFAWEEHEKGRIDPRVCPPVKVQVVDNKGFKIKAPYLNARLAAEVTEIIKVKLETGELERCKGPYAGKWYVARKPNGKVRWISNFQDLNEITIRDAGSIPRVDEFIESLCGHSIYTLLDAMGGYDQQYVCRFSRDYIAILTPFGHLRWSILPQGWTNSVARFQDGMYKIFGKYIPRLCEP
jgi:hypothetical protein